MPVFKQHSTSPDDKRCWAQMASSFSYSGALMAMTNGLALWLGAQVNSIFFLGGLIMVLTSFVTEVILLVWANRQELVEKFTKRQLS